MNAIRKIIILRLAFLLALLEGLVVFWLYGTAPSESQSIVFIQYSAPRLIILSVVLAALLMVVVVLAGSFRSGWWDHGIGKFIGNAVGKPEAFWLLLFGSSLTYALLFLSDRQLGGLAPYRDHLHPLLLWIFLTCFEFLIVILFLKGMASQFPRKYSERSRPFLTAFLLLGFLVAFVALTRAGLEPDLVYWQEAGVPLLMHQVIVAWAVCVLLFDAANRWKFNGSAGLSITIPIALWLIACIVWVGQPARPNFNSLEAAAPNFQNYPFGDALRYDTLAHGYLIGQPIPSDFRAKPLYTYFLALLHILAGEDYGLLVIIQVAVFAVIPVCIYYLTSILGGRWAGILAALLIIIREKNTLALSNVIQVAHVKSLLSDFMALGGMAVLIWAVLGWISNPSAAPKKPLIIGGILGMLVLLRGHPLMLLPFLLFGLWLVFLKQPLSWYRGTVMIAMGLFSVLAPWLWRNHDTLGKWALQDGNSLYTIHMERLYNPSPTPDLSTAPPPRPGETTEEYYERLRGNIYEYVVGHPDRVFQFITAHYFHNLIYSYIYLPHSFGIDEVRTYVKTMPFWDHWKGEMPAPAVVLLVINMAVLSLGFGHAWNRLATGVFTPLLLGVGYNLSVSVGRLSGWRFILPADWITLVFYSIGLMEVFFVVRFILTGRAEWAAVTKEEDLHGGPHGAGIVRLLIPGLFLLSGGLAVTYGNMLFSGRYPDQSAQQLIDRYQTQVSMIRGASEDDLNNILPSGQMTIIHGQALYPSFFEEGVGLTSVSWRGYQPRPYSRMIFYVMGPRPAEVVLAMEASPSAFPDGEDILAVGCFNEDGVFEAWRVLMQSDPPIQYVRYPVEDPSCPPSELNEK